jgi:hypothetical protein
VREGWYNKQASFHVVNKKRGEGGARLRGQDAVHSWGIKNTEADSGTACLLRF